jgi:hypothetical protein
LRKGVALANHLPPFGASLRVGRYPVYVCVDAVIREWLHRTINEEAANRVFSEACREIVFFFR